MQTRMHQATFEMAPILSIVGEGNSAAYCIYVTPGPQLGTLDKFDRLVQLPASNQAEIEISCARPEENKAAGSWFRRALCALGL